MELPKLPIRSFFDLSTGHIKSRDDDLLRRCDKCEAEDDKVHVLPIMVDSKDQGWIVTLIDEYRDLVDSEALIEFGFSLAFTELVRAANRKGIKGLWLDADAPIVSGLPTFSWGSEDEWISERGKE